MARQAMQSPHLFKVPRVQIVKGRTDFVLQRCAGKRVLHLGCADEGATREKIKDGTLMHLQLLKAAALVYGVDISETGLGLLRQTGVPNLIFADVEHLGRCRQLRGKDFDVIVASEIIEHLDNPARFLREVRSLFSAGTEMILTTPNPFRLAEIAHSLKGYEFVHPEHNCWFSWKTLTGLLERNRYVICETLAYSFTEWRGSILARAFKRLGRKLKNAELHPSCTNNSTENLPTWLVNRGMSLADAVMKKYLYRRNPFFADGLIFVVRPAWNFAV